MPVFQMLDSLWNKCHDKIECNEFDKVREVKSLTTYQAPPASQQAIIFHSFIKMSNQLSKKKHLSLTSIPTVSL